MIPSMHLLFAVLAVADPARADDEAARVLRDDRFAFCHDEQYPLTSFEAAWCPPVAPAKNPRCPAFQAACNAPRGELDNPGRLNFKRGAPGDDDDADDDGSRAKKTRGKSGRDDAGEAAGGDAERSTPDREVIDDSPRFQMPELGGFAYWLFWLVLGGGLLLLIVVIVRNSMRHKAEDEQPEPTPDALPESAGPAGPSEQVVRDVNLLLEQARAAASAGDFDRAIRQAHAALLHRLDHDGLISVAPSRTNGDYVADLQPKPELRAAVRDVVRDVEQVQFGATRPDAGLFDRVIKKVVPIATRRGDVLALVLGSALLSCTCEQIFKSYPYDDSPSGTRAVVELAAAHGHTLAFRTAPLPDLDLEDHGRALILLHDAFVDAETWPHLLRWAENGNHLVLAGVTPPAELQMSFMTGSSGHAVRVAPDRVADYDELTLVEPDQAHVLLPAPKADPANTPLLLRSDGQPHAIRHQRGHLDGDVHVFASDRLFTNGALMLADNPEFLARFLARIGERDQPIEMVDGMLELGSDSPAETIANTNLTAAILQLLALIGLLYLWRGVRFGAPRDPLTRSRRSYTEHIDAVGRHLARAHASRHAVRLYAGWALDRLRDRTLTGRQPGLYALAQAIAARTGDDEARVMQTLVEASGVRDDEAASTVVTPRAHSATEEFKLMQDLARLVRLVGGPR